MGPEKQEVLWKNVLGSEWSVINEFLPSIVVQHTGKMEQGIRTSPQGRHHLMPNKDEYSILSDYVTLLELVLTSGHSQHPAVVFAL